MTNVVEDAATPEAMSPATPWTPPAGPLALSEAKIAEIRALAQKADALVEASLSENTRIAYGKAWRAWSDWCLGFGLDPTGENPGAAADERWLIMHLTALSETRSLSTVLLRRAAVVAIRKRLKRPLALDDAEFEAFLKGLRRTKGARPVRKSALLEPNLRAAFLVLTPDAHPDLTGLGGGGVEGRRALRDARGVRDMALLLIGFAGGFRRSELAAFDLRDLSFSAEGLVLFVGRSKADQERHGAEVGIQAVPGSPICAVAALRRWLEARGDAPGALFCRLDRGGNLVGGSDGRLLPIDPATIARLVKRAIARTGVDPAAFSAHSLRAGMMTAADQLGIPFERAMEHGRWKSYSAARIYRRHESLWTGNFTGKLLQGE